MLNMNSENKRLLLLLILLFIFILGLVITDFFLNWQNLNTINLKSDKLTELTSSISALPKNSTSFSLRNSVNEVFDLMNNKQYEDLYSLLSSDFKENMFNNDINNFIKFMDDYAPDTYSPSYDKYNKIGNVYMLTIGFNPSSNTDDAIIGSSSQDKTDTFILTDLGDDSYSFSFLGFVGEKKINSGKGNSSFDIILNKTLLYKTNTKLYFTINNYSDSPISISPKQIYCFTSMKPRYYNHDILVLPNSSKDFCFYVGTGLSIKNALPRTINFNKIKVGDRDYTFSINAKYYGGI